MYKEKNIKEVRKMIDQEVDKFQLNIGLKILNYDAKNNCKIYPNNIVVIVQLKDEEQK